MQKGQHCCGGRRSTAALRAPRFMVTYQCSVHNYILQKITCRHPRFPVRARSQRTADDDTRRHDCRHTDRTTCDPTKIEVTSKPQRTVDAPLAVVLCGFRLTRSFPFPQVGSLRYLRHVRRRRPRAWVGGRCLSVEILSESACMHAQGLRYAKFAAMRSKRHACVSRFVVCCCRRPLRRAVRQFRHS
jgi:hypothetical protein